MASHILPSGAETLAPPSRWSHSVHQALLHTQRDRVSENASLSLALFPREIPGTAHKDTSTWFAVHHFGQVADKLFAFKCLHPSPRLTTTDFQGMLGLSLWILHDTTASSALSESRIRRPCSCRELRNNATTQYNTRGNPQTSHILLTLFFSQNSGPDSQNQG